MVVLQSTMRAGSWTQFRSFSKSFAQLEPFTREPLRNRIYKQNVKDDWKVYKQKMKDDFNVSEQNIKKVLEVYKQHLADILKQYIHHPGPSKPPLTANPVRPLRDLWKALGFAVTVGVSSFTIAFVWTNEKHFTEVGLDFYPNLLVTAEKKYIKEKDCYVTLQKEDRQKITWENMTRGEKATVYFIGANTLVYLMWKLKPLKSFMQRYFCSSFVPSSRLFSPMLLRAFSHSGLFQFGASTVLFYYAADLTNNRFYEPGRFWAFYCTAAVFSSLTSLVHQAAIRSPRHAKGSSGAIFALIGYTYMQYPNRRFSAEFEYSFRTMLYGLILFDLVCLAQFHKRSRLFDHAGQLGGTLFGIFYALIGEQIVNRIFEPNLETGAPSPADRLYLWVKYKLGHFPEE